MSKSPTSPRRAGSVQRQVVAAREVSGPLLCIAGAGGEREREYVTILRISGPSFALKSDAEQALLIERFRRFLTALDYPVQILWRFEPLDLDAYLTQLAAGQDAAVDHSELLREVAAEHLAFVRQYETRRTLLARSVYLVVRYSTPTLAPGRRLLRRASRQRQATRLTPAEALEAARQELDLRAEQITRQLKESELVAERLDGPQDLLPFYFRCLSPTLARQQPLTPALIEGIGMPTQTRLPAPARAAASLETEAVPTALPASLTRVEDLLAPALVEVQPDHLCIDGELVRVVAVTGLPRVVQAGWFRPLAELDLPLEVSFYVQPHDPLTIRRALLRQQARLQSTKDLAIKKGRAIDPSIELGVQDVQQLLFALEGRTERMFDLSISFVVRGQSEQELDQRTTRVQGTVRGTLATRIAKLEQHQAFVSTLPQARETLQRGHLVSSGAAASIWPFTATVPFHPEGVFEVVTRSGELVVLDPWAEDQPNANRVVCGPTGAGKSYGVKLRVLRRATAGRQMQHLIVDPEGEYRLLTVALGGQIVRLAPGSAQCINPFDLPQPGPQGFLTDEHDRLAAQITRLAGLLDVLLAPPGSPPLQLDQKAWLEEGLRETYRLANITDDPTTHRRPAPTMADFLAVLASSTQGKDDKLLAALDRYVRGALKGLFGGPTTVGLNRPVVCFDTRELRGELAPVGYWLITEYVWKQASSERMDRELIIDEAAILYRSPAGAAFLDALVPVARKRWLGVTLITQQAGTFQSSPASEGVPQPSPILVNCATKVVMKHQAHTLPQLASTFQLSERETEEVGRLSQGEALLLVNDQRYLGRYVASPFEHLLASTKAQELATWQRDPAYQPYRRFFTWMQQQLEAEDAERHEDAARLREALATVAAEREVPLC